MFSHTDRHALFLLHALDQEANDAVCTFLVYFHPENGSNTPPSLHHAVAHLHDDNACIVTAPGIATALLAAHEILPNHIDAPPMAIQLDASLARHLPSTVLNVSLTDHDRTVLTLAVQHETLHA